MKKESSNDSQLVSRLTELTNRGISKADMARIAGVTPQAVNGWFKKGVISKKSAIAIAEVAGVSVAWLYGESVEENSGLSKDEVELLKLYRQLPDIEQKNMVSVFSARLKELDEYVEKYLRGRHKSSEE
ncbi:transcriptional regulator [Serratia marcescens]|uniref:helix-turn-helix domain-containing protein n=1 Tax=Serratia marcescens TaxID=615 RepID=UPI0006ECE5C0|nr:helix-turn-helix domain-containing protein [Serratia marcescens]ALL37644.1 transcriptional regulator [Serratia marcescens]